MTNTDDRLQDLIAKQPDPFTVLLVDDQPFVRRIVKNAFHGLWSISFLEASEGNEALDLLMKHKIGAVILDINMLPMNGLETLQAIRTAVNGVRADMPVIMLTGVADEKAVKAAVMLDTNGFVLKPATPSVLKDRLYRVLKSENQYKTPAEYYDVLLPTGLDDELSSAPKETKEDKDKSNFEVRDGYEAVEVKASQIKNEDRLLEDIKTVNGQLMVGAGTTVTPPLMDKISDLNQIIRSDALMVERKSD